jgi:hypothetical protein
MRKLLTSDADALRWIGSTTVPESIDRMRLWVRTRNAAQTEAEVAAKVVDYLAVLYDTSRQNARTIIRVHDRFGTNSLLVRTFSFSDLALLCKVKLEEDIQSILAAKQRNPKLSRAELKSLIGAAQRRAIVSDRLTEARPAPL